MAYADLTSIQTLNTGDVLTAACMTQARDNDEWLARNKPRCRVYRTTAQNIAHNTQTGISFDAERVDTGAMHSTSVNTSRMTVPAGGAGWYDLGGHVEFAGNATGYRNLSIRLNGATYIAVENIGPVSTTVMRMSIHTEYQLAVGDYFELVAFQTSGAGLDVNAAGNYSAEAYMTWKAI